MPNEAVCNVDAICERCTIRGLREELAKAQAENARLAAEVSAWSALVNDIMQEGPPQHPKYVVRAKHLADEANISTLRDLLGPTVELLQRVKDNPYSVSRAHLESELARLREAMEEK